MISPMPKISRNSVTKMNPKAGLRAGIFTVRGCLCANGAGQFVLDVSWVFTNAATGSLHTHDLIAAVHIDHLPRDRRRAVAGEKNPRRAQFVRQHVALERRVGFVMLEHVGE